MPARLRTAGARVIMVSNAGRTESPRCRPPSGGGNGGFVKPGERIRNYWAWLLRTVRAR